MNKFISWRLLTLFTVAALFNIGCSALTVDKRAYSSAFTDAPNTRLGRHLASETVDKGSDLSGFILLDTGTDALQKRLALLDSSEKSVDLQYYIWNSDKSGRLLAQKLFLAAERGVRVRLLLDDFNIGDRDALLLIMDVHPNIEVRIYNPNSARSGVRKVFGLIGNFSRLNQRMHNKTFTVDASISIVGGRNIGDEYFDLHHELNFRDRDLLAVGPVVRDISESFDAYWNNERAFAITKMTREKPTQAEVLGFRTRLTEPGNEDFMEGEESNDMPLASKVQLQAWLEEMIWAPAELVYDQPLGFDEQDDDSAKRVAIRLKNLALSATSEVLIESPYLIPGDEGIELLAKMTQSGVQVSALTNSLASNDLTTNHAGYARRRESLLKSGVELFELKPNAASCQHLVVGIGRCDDDTLFGLHSKSMVFDGKAVFVGSFNFNQRSVYLNSETALIIYSAELAKKIADDIKENFSSKNSWHVSLDEGERLQWAWMDEGVVRYYRHEPQTGFLRRFNAGLFSIFPFEKY